VVLVPTHPPNHALPLHYAYYCIATPRSPTVLYSMVGLYVLTDFSLRQTGENPAVKILFHSFNTSKSL